ncbi:acetylserine transporter [Paramesorhizobium deserti]|uniref:Acetylserine transporter n=1 Tax=Paramesorhizobium deserti TaxID=1494590 RepID=A0A135HWD0_9HYPH|nr:EamA family transporter [Paramesorhizobium deserti]KXF77468.1 acetylserine transporter [Paramesorhizobium deserti]
MPLKHVLLAILAAAAYGFAFVAIKAGVAEIPPLLLTGYRFFFAAVPLVFFAGRPDVGARWLIAYGVMQGVVMFGLLFMAISLGMPAGLASIVVQMQVFFTIVISAVLFGERPGPTQIAGAAVALAGIGLIGWSRAEDAPLMPFLLVLVSAAAWGIANIIAKAAKPQKMLPFVLWSSLAAPVPLFVLSAVFEGTTFGLPPHMPSLVGFGSIAFLAWPTTVFAFTAWVFLLRKHPAAVVTPFALLIPVFGMGSTAVAFGERLDAQAALGSLLIFFGLMINIFGPRLVRRI